jgi:hypothetical protein
LYPPVSPHQAAVVVLVSRRAAVFISATRPAKLAVVSPVHMPGYRSALLEDCVWVRTKPRPPFATADKSYAVSR